jgi:hypothetical protein
VSTLPRPAHISANVLCCLEPVSLLGTVMHTNQNEDEEREGRSLILQDHDCLGSKDHNAIIVACIIIFLTLGILDLVGFLPILL